MSETIIKVENLSKTYRIGEWGTGTLSHDLNRWWAKLRGKPDPFLKVGQLNDRTRVAQKGELVNALSDINFEVKQGEVLGIIGKNGAGKSTLLKILSRITAPTTGQALIKGRVASLLEVGTGFHPEMTGRENVYLNGTINGMNRHEVKRKLDEIVEFAGVAKYLDTPVKRFSSGMTVRLGFAVAAFLEPEILIVDEVLAVGDAEFQKKAIGKMQDVSEEEGRTVLFVSHNMDTIIRLCGSCISLQNGFIKHYGDSSFVINNYLNDNIENNYFKNGKIKIEKTIKRNGSGEVFLEQINLFDEKKEPCNYIKMNQMIILEFHFFSQINAKNVIMSIVISNTNKTPILAWRTNENFTNFDIEKGNFVIRINTEKINIIPGLYSMSVAISTFGVVQDWIPDVVGIEIIPNEDNNRIKIPEKTLIYIPCSWEIISSLSNE